MKCLLMVRTLKEEVSRERLLLAVVARESGNGEMSNCVAHCWIHGGTIYDKGGPGEDKSS